MTRSGSSAGAMMAIVVSALLMLPIFVVTSNVHLAEEGR